MPKIPKKLEDIRKVMLYEAWKNNEYNLDLIEIGKIFGVSLSLAYDIIKELRIKDE